MTMPKKNTPTVDRLIRAASMYAMALATLCALALAGACGGAQTGTTVDGVDAPLEPDAAQESAEAAPGSDGAEDGPATVTLIAISDFHGALEPYRMETADGNEVIMGGAALLSAYVNRIREQADGPVVLLDGGDLYQGTLASNLGQGEAVIRFYNLMGVDAAAVGNHEFDFGPLAPERTVAVEPGDDPLGTLKARVDEANFPLLAANMFDEEGNVPSWASASTVLERDGVRIGIVGAATVDTPSTTIPANVESLTFAEAADPVRTEAERLRAEEDVDVVLLTAHIGSGCSSFDDPDDLSVCRDGELLRTLEAMPEGLIDGVVGGHTHQGVAHRMGRTAILQPFAQGRSIGWATIDLRSDAPPVLHGPVSLCGTVVEDEQGEPTCHGRRVPHLTGEPRIAQFLGQHIVADSSVTALLEDDFAAVEELKRRSLNVEIGEEIPRSYREESALGNLLVDLMRASRETDLAVTNGGGIRAEMSAGHLTYGEFFEILPFDNRYVDMELTGAQIRRIVEHGVTSGRSALLWSGLTYQEEGCEVVRIYVDGERLEDDATYTLTLNDYLAGGGSGFGELGLPEPVVDWAGPGVRDDLADEIGNLQGPLFPSMFFNPDAPRQMRSGEECG